MSDPNKAFEGAITGVAKEAYSDLIRPSASPIGEALSGIIKAIAFYPRFWARALDISLDEKTERFKRNLEEKVNQIPIGSRILPAPYILGPSIQALEYGIIDDEISDLFSSLIASSMDSSKVVHQSFVELIKQINSDEAKILKSFRDHERFYFLQIRESPRLREKYLKVVYFNGCQNPKNTSLYLDNLKRLGIIEYNERTYENLGLKMENSSKDSFMEEIVELYNDFTDDAEEDIPPHSILYNEAYLSHLGQSFLDACMPKERSND